MCLFVCLCVYVCVCVLLTQRGVVEGEVSQVAGVLRQGEQSSWVTVPHQAAPRAVLQHPVLDDLHRRSNKQNIKLQINKVSSAVFPLQLLVC